MSAFRAGSLACLTSVGAALFACLPGPLDLTGKQCSVDRPCGSGYYCQLGACQPGSAPGLVNLLQNPDFEQTEPDGGLPHWHVTGLGKLSIEREIVHDGGTAAHVLSTDADGGTSPRLNADALLDAGRFVFCATAWVYGVDAGGTSRVTLSLSARYDGGTFSQGGNSTTLMPAPFWQQLSANIDTTQEEIAPDSLSYTFTTSNLGVGQVLIADDGWLWQPLDGQCP